jgi:hypothetical protein
VSAYAALSSEARALVSLVTSVLTAVATIFFAWLQSQLKALGEGTRRNEDATGRKIEEASRRSEEAAKEASRRSEEASRRTEEAAKEAARRSEEAAKEVARNSEEAAKEAARRSEEAARRSEEAAKEAARRSEAIMDLIRNEHRKSMQDSKLSNYFVVLVSALSFLIPRLRS